MIEQCFCCFGDDGENVAGIEKDETYFNTWKNPLAEPYYIRKEMPLIYHTGRQNIRTKI